MDTSVLPPPGFKSRQRNEYVAPQNEVQQILVDIWQELLQVEKIGVLDHFFNLGGDSLLVIREISMIRERLNVEMPVKDMFVYNTISDLAKQVEHQEKIVPSTTFSSTSRPEKIPLSFSQERLWFIDKLQGSTTYHLSGAFRLKGILHPQALQNALREIVNRHEILRTVFHEENAEVRQHILDKNQWQVQLVEHTALLNAEELKKYMADLTSRPFDLSQDHPFRCQLLKLSDGWMLALTIHHIASDGWSRSIIIRELAELYSSYMEVRPHRLPALPFQYADYSLWQRQWLNEESLQIKLAYWKDKLEGLSYLNLPLDRVRPLVQDHKGSILSFNIEKDLSVQLAQFARDKDVTLFMLLLTVLKVMLYRYSGKEDICVGSPVAGRTRREVEDLIGIFINVLPLRSRVHGNLSFENLLIEVKQTILQGFENQEFPFEKIVQSIAMERDMSRNPLFQVMFILQNTPDIPHLQLGDVEISDEPVTHQVSMFDFTMSLTETTQGLQGTIEYDTNIFDEITMLRMIGHYQQLLQSVLKEPLWSIDKLQMITNGELHQVVNEFNDTATPFPQDQGIANLFEEQVLLMPEAVAILHEAEQITYRQLNERSNQLAYHLQKIGVEQQQYVAICMERSIELIISILAVLKLNAIYIPIEPAYPQARISYLLGDTNPVAVLTTRNLVGKISNYTGHVICSEDQSSVLTPLRNTENILRADKLLNIIYTSGSTGKPKGVKISERSVLNRLHWMWETYPFENGEKCVCKTSIGFVDHICEIFSPLLHGVPLVIISKEILVDVGIFIRILADLHVTRLLLVPSLLRVMLQKIKEDQEELPYLKYWTTSGELLSPDLIESFYEIFPPENFTLLNIYGSTEVTADITCFNTARKVTRHKRIMAADLFSYTWKHEVKELIHDFRQRKTVVQTNEQYQPTVTYEVNQAWDGKAYLSFLKNELLPGIINISKPEFIGHMTGPIPEFIRELSDLMVAANQNLVKIETSSAATFLEREVNAILHKLVYKFDDSFYDQQLQESESSLGVITNGGTLSNITALSYAFNRKFPPDSDFKGITHEGLIKALSYYDYKSAVVIGSPSTHYSIGKALQLLGLGKDSFVPFHFDKRNVMEARERLEHTIEELKSKRIAIIAIVGVAGATETGLIDPLDILGEIADEYDIHYHVDAAFGGAFLFSSRLSGKLKGIELADSVTICAHKQLLLPVGASVCVFKSPGFARYSENNTNYQARKNSFDQGRFTIEGSRPFTSLLLHCLLKMAGGRSLGELAECNYKRTLLFASMIKAHPAFELVGESELNILNYRYIPRSLRNRTGKDRLTTKEIQAIDEINVWLQQRQFSEGRSFVSYTRIKHPEAASDTEPVVVLRVVMMNPSTTQLMLKEILEEQEALVETFGVGWPQVALPIVKSAVPFKRPRTGKLIGKPIDNTRIYVMDQHLHPLPIGIPGEICVAGIPVSLGFLNAIELNETKFIYHTVGNKGEEKLFRTGDMGRWLTDGNLEYIGRKDDQLKIRGYRVEPTEIERVLSESGLVRQSVVILRDDNSGNQQLIGYVVANECDTEEILTYLQICLPAYMVPSVLVPLEKLPLNANGKINKHALPIPDLGNLLNKQYKAPRSHTEEKLCAIWQESLALDRIGILDNFFSLGGHSLLAFRLTSEIKKVFGIELAVKQIFLHPTVATLAINIEAVLLSGCSLAEEQASVVIQTNIAPELKYDNKNYYAIHYSLEYWVNEVDSAYKSKLHGILKYRLSGIVDQEILNQAVAFTVARHESLRACFRLIDTKYYMSVRNADDPAFKIEYRDIENKSATDHTRFANFDDLKFNVEEGPLFCTRIVRINEGEHIVSFWLHHAIFDGWSTEVLVKDIFLLIMLF